jgi:hypothetical protein
MLDNKEYREENQSLELKDKHAYFLNDFQDIQDTVYDDREQSLKDRRFCTIAGAMWEGIDQQFANKPMMEVNKAMRANMRLMAEYRNNKFGVEFISKKGDASDKMAETCNGLFRADEQDSNADEAYDNAYDEGIGGGFGAMRLRADYEDHEDDENEYQRILFEPITDADSCVFYDLGAKRQDKSDAKRCYVLSSMPRKEYEDEYNDTVASWPKEIQQTEFDWATDDVVYICEAYEVEETKKTVLFYEDRDGKEIKYTEEDFESDETLADKLAVIGTKKVREKKIKVPRVHKYIMSGGKILEDCGCIAGKNIPIVPYYAKRWFIDNIERFMGHVRIVKDLLRLKNMLISWLAEISASNIIEKPIFTQEQVAGHEVAWAESNLNNNPYEVVNAVTDLNGNEIPMGPIAYTKPPQIPPAIAALMQIVEIDIQDLLGNQGNAEKMVSNIGSKTVEMIQSRIDTYDYIYISNMAKMKKRVGEVWLSMARELFVESKREMKSIGSQDEISSIELNRPITGENGEVVYENDFSKAHLDVSVDIGPSTNSKRDATVKGLRELLPTAADPQDRKVITSMIMMNMEGEGIKDVRDYYRQQLIKMGVVKPTNEEAEELMKSLEGQPPDPNEVLMKAAAENEIAKAGKAQAETIETIADTEKTKAETVKIYSEIDQSEAQQAIQTEELLNAGAVQPPNVDATNIGA